MDNQSTRIARALAESAKAIHSTHSVEEALDAIAREAQRSVPGFDHVGISLIHKDGAIETMAATDQLVWELDQLQYQLGEGPCMDSMRKESLVVVDHAEHEQRWPRFMAQAVQRGLRAQMAVRLYSDGDTLGGLNLYSTESDTVDPDAVQVADLFATHAAIALGQRKQEQQLNEALESRKVIGQAIGIVMERYGINEDRAFHFLVRASSTSNIKLRTIAQELVETTGQKYSTEGQPRSLPQIAELTD